jgi:hypothetical protein
MRTLQMSSSGTMARVAREDLVSSAAPAAEVGSGAGPSGVAVSMSLTMLVGALALGVLAIVAASFSGLVSVLNAGVSRPEIGASLDRLSLLTKFLLKFDVGGEQTVAAWFSSALLLVCGLVLLHIGTLKRRCAEPYARHWLLLSFIFFGLSMDESVGFHESLIDPVRALFETSGIFLYAWIIPAIAGVLVVGLAYLGFVLHLERHYRNRIIAAGVVFLAGALGFEMMEGAFAAFYASHLLIYETAVHVEDTLEFAGILLFLHTMMRYAQGYCREITIQLR